MAEAGLKGGTAPAALATGEPAAPALPAPVHLTPTTPGWTLYEVTAEIDPARLAEFDGWLPDHVDAVLKQPGFVHADILVRENVAEGPRAGWSRRIIQYKVRSAAQLDAYLAGPAQSLREQAVDRFGSNAWFERRVLTHSAHRNPGEVPLEYCQNCGSMLAGQYCASCGQRSRVRIISLWHLIREAAGDLTHLDSRLWRTMKPLLFRPGYLTNEYLAGRRTRYIPPFRLYLGLSIVFFVLASLGTSQLEESGASSAQTELTPEDRARLEAGKEQVARELAQRGITVPGLPTPSGGPKKADGTAPASTGQTADTKETAGNSTQSAAPGVTTKFRKDAEVPCDALRLDLDFPGRDNFNSRLARACRKIAADSGREFFQAVIHNIPKMMFVFLPLLAAVNKGMYPLSRRYYVEHLLFFVHFHAFAFLLFSLKAVFDLATGSFAWLEILRDLLTLVIVFYIPVYLFKAMRRVYGQGRLATAFKFVMLYFAYVLCLTLTLIGGVIYTALTM